MFLFTGSFNVDFKASAPSLVGILVQRDQTSIEIRTVFVGRLLTVDDLLRKSIVSLT